MFDKNLFSERLSALRKNKKVSQLQLAEHVQVTFHQISKMENGQRAASIEVLYALADYFEVSLDFLTGRSIYSYVVTEDELEGCKHYGIKATSLDGTVQNINDISISPEKILVLIEKLSRYNVSIEHLLDIISDEY